LTTEVIILAQGTQKRMGPGVGYKQLLPLPACGKVPILARTLRQLAKDSHLAPCHITLLTWRGLHLAMEGAPTYKASIDLELDMIQLPEPGNSALKGIARYLELRGAKHHFTATAVLLGDVVYSWQCLLALREMAATGGGFVGTSNLSEHAGEIWGVAWPRAHEDAMLDDLRDAMLRHPPFEDEYQPGQLRRWITGMRRGALALHVTTLTRSGRYRSVDDYTMDVDLPTHIRRLGPASVAAAADDAQHGLTWESAGSERR
jgi:hypothetical protein